MSDERPPAQQNGGRENIEQKVIMDNKRSKRGGCVNNKPTSPQRTACPSLRHAMQRNAARAADPIERDSIQNCHSEGRKIRK
jgi:hypothetical protein